MITRIIVVLAVIGMLAGIYAILKEPEQSRPEGFPSGSDIRSLKIN